MHLCVRLTNRSALWTNIRSVPCHPWQLVVIPLVLDIFHLNLTISLSMRINLRLLLVVVLFHIVIRVETIDLITLLLLLHLHSFSFGHYSLMILLSTSKDLSRSMPDIIIWGNSSSIVGCPHLLAKFTLNGLEPSHLPLTLLNVGFTRLMCILIAPTLNLCLSLVHLLQVLRVIVLGQGLASHWGEDASHCRGVLFGSGPTLDIHFCLSIF